MDGASLDSLPTELEADVSSLLTDPYAACRAYLTHARAPLLRSSSLINAVAPMHPHYLTLGVETPEACEADAKAAAAAEPPVSPIEAALQRHATLSGIVSFEGGRALLATTPEEFIVSLLPFRDGSCVDTALVGLLRLATVLAEADPAIAGNALSATPAIHAAGMEVEQGSAVRFLYSTCLFALPETRAEAVPFVTSAPSSATPLPTAPAAATTALVRVPFAGVALPKCKTIVSRRAALGLLVALSRRSVSNLEELGDLLVRVRSWKE